MQASQVDPVEGLDVVATLDTVEALHAQRIRAEAQTFVLAAHFADLHAGDTLQQPQRPGRERAVRLGGAGTPTVAEFAVAEFGCRVQLGSWAARRYVADALDVRHRLPLVWQRVCAGAARVGNARLVAARTRHLSMEAAAQVDRAMADHVDGSLPWGRFEARLDGVVVAADPATAAAREQARMLEQFAKRTRSSEDGTAGFYVRSSIGVIARLDATVGFLAEALTAFGDTDDLDRRRVKAMVLLGNPASAVELLTAFKALRARSVDTPLPLDEHDDEECEPIAEPASEPADALSRMDAFARRVGFSPTRLPRCLEPRQETCDDNRDENGVERPAFTFSWPDLLPPVTLYLHLAAKDLERGEGGEGGVVRWEGEGPVTHQYVHDHLRPLHRYLITPVVDLAQMAPVDAYEIPDRHRRAVRLRTPADCFPFSSDTSARLDIDHSQAYRHADDQVDEAGQSGQPEQPGQSRLENYGPLGRFHHRIKTHGDWTVRQPFPGIYLWRDRHGQIYLVDHTGSRKVTRPAPVA